MSEAITPELFAEWRAPRIVADNPTRLDNRLWASLVHDRINAYQVNKRYGYEREYGTGPTWCFDRFGQSATALGDGRTIYIAGEHEDYYDPDFYIYNDVAIVAPDGAVAFYGYPRAAFPPTDFHTATLDGERIWLVGSLGYGQARLPGVTQVCRLDLGTFAIEPLATTGAAPGWIHKHAARLDGGALVVQGGLVAGAPDASFEENIDEWALDLATLVWTRRTALDWQRWAVRRADGKRSALWELRQHKWKLDHPGIGMDYREGLEQQLGAVPDVARVDDLYRCAGATPVLRDGDDYNVFRIELDGVHVRFTEESDRIAAMVEGRLAAERLRELQDHVLARLGELHFTAWELEP